MQMSSNPNQERSKLLGFAEVSTQHMLNFGWRFDVGGGQGHEVAILGSDSGAVSDCNRGQVIDVMLGRLTDR